MSYILFKRSTSASLPNQPPTKLAASNGADAADAAIVSTTPSEKTFDQADVLQHILSYLGPNQHRFVAYVGRRFRDAYDPISTWQTFLNLSTKDHARICWDEINEYNWRGNNETMNLWKYAISRRNMVGLENLRAAECPWHDDVCFWAAQDGHIDILKWFREHGAPVDECTCNALAKSGDLSVLQWCRDNGCPWNEWTCFYAAKSGHLKVIKWCRENGCPWNADTINATIDAVISNDDLEMLLWCRDHGCPWNIKSIRSKAIRCGSGEIADWCDENRS